MTTIQITVIPAQIGFNSYGWCAYSEQLGGIDYDWTGDGWRNCGSPQGEGKTIPEAIDEFLEKIEEDQPSVSDCCGSAPRGNGDNDSKDYGICPDCGDHCEYVPEEVNFKWN